MEEKQEKKEEQKEEYSLIEVPTGRALAIQNKEGEILTFEELIVSLANRLAKLEKLVG